MTPYPDPPPARGPRSWWGRLAALDRIAVGLALTGAVCVLTGLLPRAEAEATLGRIVPLLLFLGTIVALAELAALAGVFDVLAARAARAARGSYPTLFLLCVLFATVTTVTFNLDTTAVLLTPVLIALARTVAVSPLPLAVTTVWLANTASLLLPVSNLTTILAIDRIGLDPLPYVARMAGPQLVAVVVTGAALWWWYWRPARPADGRFAVPTPRRPPDLVRYRIALSGCLLFVVGVLAGAPVGLASGVAAGVLVVGFAVRDRAALRPGLVPWRLLVFVTGLFLVVRTAGWWGLDALTGTLVGADPGTEGVLRAATVGLVSANTVNNLPAYLVAEAVIPAGHHDQLLALLIGVNVGPLVTPWASLATLIWYERCRSAGVRVPWGRLAVTGAALAVTGVAATVGTLLLLG
ncbi:ArsB/NhaD family transporter [Micromonospora sp. WMMD882]|uniref:SLC13 family permease n=1 Tax=Micromonospora sp. WMMD882 TaxID=3015151 RepID=UPI00248A92A0|nr:SLC13 family permease [Micromonospora sp. WMMD882]WBB81206.1 ArsB/NhaD family transporter [Micromonospora sp. WMMD882]